MFVIVSRCNEDKCRRECKKLIDRGMCDKGFVWNPSNWECECDKSCGVGEYLDYKNYKCRKRLVDKLIDECSENNDGNEMTNVTLNEYTNVCGSYAIHILIFVISFLIKIDISSAYFYFHWYLKIGTKSNTDVVNITSSTEATIY